MADEADQPTRMVFNDWPRLMAEPIAATYLSIGKTLLRGLRLPSVKIGRRVLYDRLELDAYADSLSGRRRVLSEEEQAAEVTRRFLAKRGKRVGS